tara:strand:+ start:110 stop:289 length:180 start_codon:yes stop_codon:yes gene_type:complete
MKRQAFKVKESSFGLVQSKKMNPVFAAQRCCLRCGRVEDIGSENIDSCEDCRVMAFNID